MSCRFRKRGHTSVCVCVCARPRRWREQTTLTQRSTRPSRGRYVVQTFCSPPELRSGVCVCVCVCVRYTVAVESKACARKRSGGRGSTVCLYFYAKGGGDRRDVTILIMGAQRDLGQHVANELVLGVVFDGTVATVEKTSGTFSDGERGTLARRREDECGNFYRCREQRHQRRREDMSARYRRQGRKDERGHSLVTVISRCEKMGARGTLSGVERGQTQQQPLPVS